MKLEPIDQLIALSQGPVRSLDCIVALKNKKSYSESDLRERSLAAQKFFPKTNAHPVSIRVKTSLADFLSTDLLTPYHLELAIIDDLLALKMSHLLGDAVSMVLWLKALEGEEVSSAAIEYKTFPKKKDSPYRKLLTSDPWPSGKKTISHERAIHRLTLSHPVEPVESNLNDIITLALLEILPQKRKAIWVPVNVRKNFRDGFGNGLSRMRVYPLKAGSFREKLKYIKAQKIEARTSGEIALPPMNLNLFSPVKKILFQSWVKRPWADWGTISLSHLMDHDHFFTGGEPLWGVSNIVASHTTAIFGVSTRESTWITMTYDPAGVSRVQIEELAAGLEKKFHEVLDDLRS